MPAGWLTDRFGPRLLITIGITGVAACGLFIGLSSNYFLLLVFLILMGITGGGYHPAAAPLISQITDSRNRGSILGLHQIGGTASFFLSPLVAAGLAAALGWRGSFITLSIPAMAFGIFLFIFLGKREYSEKGKAESTGNHASANSEVSGWQQLATITFLGIIIQVLLFSVVGFLPLYAVDQLNASNEAAAAMLSIAYSAGLWAGPAGGYLSDRFGKVPILLIVCLLAGPALYLLSMASMGWSLYLLLVILGIFMYASMPASESYIISHAPERRRGTVLGIYYAVSRGGAGLITPAMGYIIGKYNFGICFTALGAIMLLATIVSAAFLWSNRNRTGNSKLS